MPNIVPSRLGAANAVVTTEADRRALFLKVFSGEILKAFMTQNKALERSMVRTITSGKLLAPAF